MIRVVGLWKILCCYGRALDLLTYSIYIFVSLTRLFLNLYTAHSDVGGTTTFFPRKRQLYCNAAIKHNSALNGLNGVGTGKSLKKFVYSGYLKVFAMKTIIINLKGRQLTYKKYFNCARQMCYSTLWSHCSISIMTTCLMQIIYNLVLVFKWHALPFMYSND